MVLMVEITDKINMIFADTQKKVNSNCSFTFLTAFVRLVLLLESLMLVYMLQ